MEQVTTYTVKGDSLSVLWEFKYDLKGNLISFQIQDKPLSTKQITWLFKDGNFPETEAIMKSVWLKAKKSVFEIFIGEPDLTFDAFYNAYDHKVKKSQSQASWKRLSKKDKIAALGHIPIYDKFLARKRYNKAAPSVYLNQRYWEDNHGSIH